MAELNGNAAFVIKDKSTPIGLTAESVQEIIAVSDIPSGETSQENSEKSED